MTNPWPMVPLGEILAERKEVPFPTDIESGNIRIVSKIGFKEGKIELRSGAETKTGMILIRPGDLVVSGINAAKGAIAIYEEENTEPIAATIHYGSYIPNKDIVDVKFLWWLLRSRTFRELLLEYVPGGIKTELKAKRLLPVPIPLPRLAEQQRIVVRIEELAAKIEEAKGLRQKAVEEAEALSYSSLNKVFDELQNKYGNTQIGRFSTVKGGKRIPKGESLSNEPTPYPYIRVSDMKEHSVTLNDLRYVPNHVYSSIANYTINSNDVYVTIAGTIGYPGTIPYELEGANLTENAAKIVFDSPKIYVKHL